MTGSNSFGHTGESQKETTSKCVGDRIGARVSVHSGWSGEYCAILSD